MSDEISESAKAIQEVAKTSRKAIEATEKLGLFVSKVTKEPIATMVGILSDKLRFMRWERQLRLRDRCLEIIRERKLEGHFNVVSPKLALPIIENASLEENDELQDLWANLLASALDPNFKGAIRTAYINIIKQLEPIDVHVLNIAYQRYKQWHDGRSSVSVDAVYYSPSKRSIPKNSIMQQLGISAGTYENAIDNLMAVRCVASYMEDRDIEFVDESLVGTDVERVTIDWRYDSICMTSLGVSFVEACTNRTIQSKRKREAKRKRP